MVAIDVYSRKIIGYAVQKSDCTGPSVCRMFNEILTTSGVTPKRISTDNDPLFEFHRWKSNLRIAEIEEIKTVPGIGLSHPFVERVIGTTRRECLDQVLFWTEYDLKRKLQAYQKYYNQQRVHYSLGGMSPDEYRGKKKPVLIDLRNYRWQQSCGGLFSIPIAA
jgi:putative transposase